MARFQNFNLGTKPQLNAPVSLKAFGSFIRVKLMFTKTSVQEPLFFPYNQLLTTGLYLLQQQI